MIDPRLEELTRIAGVTYWRVDGLAIRNKLDIEFTVSAHHYNSPYIPKDEIWLDREASGTDEWRAWAGRAQLERDLRQKGVPARIAFAQGFRYEGRIRDGWRERSELKAFKEFIYGAQERNWGPQAAELGVRAVVIVPGKIVRDWYWPDFVHGGHWVIYPFIPEGMIWIDDILVSEDRQATVVHELHELALMLDGMSYGEAHPKASAAELNYRRYGDDRGRQQLNA